MIDKPIKLHAIGNAHLDPVWLWPWTEGFHEVKATFRSALDRMREYEDFIFIASSAAYYEWVEKNDPQMFEEIQQRVREGRWKLVGGWWIQPDCNLPCGESFVRQALYGQRFFYTKFGVMATVGYNVDSFGHSGMLPQILVKSGLPNYVFMRPGPSEKELPSSLFWWESDDGSRVLTYRIPFSYATWPSDLEDAIRLCAGEFAPPITVGMFFYGVGNHGGGPTIDNIESIKRLQHQNDFPELVFSAPNLYFDEVRGEKWELPVVHDDLQYHASGCYSAHSGVKRWNRRAENQLMAAEKWSVISRHITGLPYPTDFIHAWKNVLFCQFHDILAGTCIASAYEDVHNFYGEALAIAGRNLNAAIQALAWRVHIEPEPATLPILVFNPHSWDCQLPVEIEINQPPENAVLIDDINRVISHQYVRSESTTPWRARVCFLAQLPSLGYRVYRLTSGNKRGHESKDQYDTVLENKGLRLILDRETGWINSLYDKRIDGEILAGPAAKPVVISDLSDTWSHKVFSYEEEIGSFSNASIQVLEHGSVKTTLRVANTYNQSHLTQDFTLYQNQDIIEVYVTVDWHEKNKLLKLRFPFQLAATHTTYEIPYGHIERLASGEENPGLNWVDVTGTFANYNQPYGVSLLNDGKYSFDSRYQGNSNLHDIGLTVLRSPVYAHHLPMELDPNRTYDYMDQGQHSFRYAILPHIGGWEENSIVQRAAELNQPPHFVILGTFHPDGSLPQINSFLSVDVSTVVVSVLKQAEENDDMILRCYEIAGHAEKATISLPFSNRTITVTMSPYEIKTIRFPIDLSTNVREVNLLEY